MNTIAAQDIKRRGICAVDEALKKRHPELRTILAGVLRDLEKDPFQPHLPPPEIPPSRREARRHSGSKHN